MTKPQTPFAKAFVSLIDARFVVPLSAGLGTTAIFCRRGCAASLGKRTHVMNLVGGACKFTWKAIVPSLCIVDMKF